MFKCKTVKKTLKLFCSAVKYFLQKFKQSKKSSKTNKIYTKTIYTYYITYTEYLIKKTYVSSEKKNLVFIQFLYQYTQRST